VNLKPKAPKLELPLHWVTGLSSSLLLLVAVTLLAFTAYRGSQDALLSAAEEAVSYIDDTVEQRLRGMLEPAEDQLHLLLYSDLVSGRTLQQRLGALPEIYQALGDNPLIDALYAGYPDGEFVLFRPLRDEAARLRFDAPPGAVMLVQSISLTASGKKLGEYRYFDKNRRLLLNRARPDYRYDPRTRPWYGNALKKDDMVLSEPYLFFTTQALGITLTHRALEREAVLGIDITLESIGGVFEALRLTPSTEFAVTDQEDRVMAYGGASYFMYRLDGEQLRLVKLPQLESPPLDRAAALLQTSSKTQSASIDGRGWRLVKHRLEWGRDYALNALIAIPEDELFIRAHNILDHQVFIALAVLVLSMPFGWWLTQRLTRPLQRLVEDTRAIEAFDFSPRPPLASHIAEVERLAMATRRMTNTIVSFLDTSEALGTEVQVERLLEIILHNTLSAIEARCGAVYLVRGTTLTKAREAAPPGGEVRAYAETLGQDEVHSIAVQAWLAQSLRVNDEGEVATPLLTRNGILVGVMLISVDAEKPLRGGTEAHDPRIGFVRALSSTAAVAIEMRKLIEQQKILLESFIKLIAAAIDAKSPYTGGHCQRVPELAKMLAHAANDTAKGHFKNFHLSEQEWEALHIAAWLHDCGKVSTSESVIDKATKLETTYDRIHEVRMRFEVLKRDAEIAALRARLNGAEAGAAEAALHAAWRQLDEEFAFVAQCNIGSETMDPAQIERLKTIAERTWQRTLDDRLGLSWAELEHRRKISEPEPLPATEKLLADKPEHLIPRPASERFEPDNKWGFKMDVPEYKANHGELYNLSIRRGTLTLEDRYLINHHMIQTIIMLDSLPFPHELQNVPEIAGGHHERMDGKGYPKRIYGGDMSVLARIMAIADVFEALTASDRPYKRANTLSQAVRIMANMVRDQHLDRDLFRLFVESGTYRVYGKRFLDASQCDEVDISEVLALAGLV